MGLLPGDKRRYLSVAAPRRNLGGDLTVPRKPKMGALRCRACRGVPDPIPKNAYLQWQHDADRRYKSGQRQGICEGCGLYEWKPEFAEPADEGEVVV